MFMFLMSNAPAATASSGSGGFMDAFKENPYFIVLNIICSAIVVAVIIERTIFQFTKYSVNSKEFFAQIKKLVTGGNVDRAIKLCEAGEHPTLQLVKSGLVNANKGPDDIDAAMSEKMSELKPAVEKRVGMLWSLANIATLIGLLGTVFGLIHTFAKVSDASLSQADRQRALANGIAEAMYNTAIGLGIAVVCMIAHLWLHGRSKNILHDLDATQERVFNLLTIQARPGA
jgi:biopolymer transport protein ExbB